MFHVGGYDPSWMDYILSEGLQPPCAYEGSPVSSSTQARKKNWLENPGAEEPGLDLRQAKHKLESLRIPGLVGVEGQL